MNRKSKLLKQISSQLRDLYYSVLWIIITGIPLIFISKDSYDGNLFSIFFTALLMGILSLVIWLYLFIKTFKEFAHEEE